ncbi:hypothetical protein L2E82_22715 [Cichorium intybus]|uniref:Uncharacterized protein n=1 Tax=Cichorium intybus TaxID=13427 RepID=A0ACB9DYB4_CICIN|nr:hypothetical protein L2E82_22715 [Cichorium intybus]
MNLNRNPWYPFPIEVACRQDLESDMKGYYIGIYLEKYVESVIKESVIIKQNGEHKHECGVNWPAALPSETVLAGRVIVKIYVIIMKQFVRRKFPLLLDLDVSKIAGL